MALFGGDDRPAGPPMAELHCHIEGAASPRLVAAQARRYGVDVSGIVRGETYVWHDFTSFLAAYDLAASVFRTPEDYALLAEEHLGGLAANGAIYAEIFVSPDHAERAGLSPAAYVDALAEGARRAEAASGIVCRMVVVGVRHFGASTVEAAARFAAHVRHPLVTGFGLAGDERAGEPGDFARAFDIARDAGLGLTAHAGEFCGAQSVRATLDSLKPSRIGHGVRAIENAGLVRRLAGEGVVLEVCPHSNLALGVFTDAASHPLRRLHETGVRATLNSDDPPFFATSLAAEYEFARARQGFGAAELLSFTRNAIEAAFVDEETRHGLTDRLLLTALSAGAPPEP